MAEMGTTLWVALKTVNPAICSSVKQYNKGNITETEKITVSYKCTCNTGTDKVIFSFYGIQ